MKKTTRQDGWASPLAQPTVPRRQKNFEGLEASQLFCPTCKRAMPVRKRLLLVLLDKEIYEYACTGCGSALAKKEQPWRGSA